MNKETVLFLIFAFVGIAILIVFAYIIMFSGIEFEMCCDPVNI